MSDHSSANPTPRSGPTPEPTPTPSRRRKKDNSDVVGVMSKASEIMDQVVGRRNNREKDKFDHFGAAIASSIRDLAEPRAQALAMARMQQMVFDIGFGGMPPTPQYENYNPSQYANTQSVGQSYQTASSGHPHTQPPSHQPNDMPIFHNMS